MSVFGCSNWSKRRASTTASLLGHIDTLRRYRLGYVQDDEERVTGGKTQSDEIGDPVVMLELISLLFSTLARLSRKRRDLVVENRAGLT
jgi:hypothetical protein